MFTNNLYNIIDWQLTYNTGQNPSTAVSSANCNKLIIHPYDDAAANYKLWPRDSLTYLQNATKSIDYFVNNPFRVCRLSMGYYTTGAFNPYETQTPALTTHAYGKSCTLVGDDKKYLECVFWRVYSKETQQSLNKVSLLADINSYFAKSGYLENSVTKSIVILSEPISTPIVLNANEHRRFTFKISFPLFY